MFLFVEGDLLDNIHMCFFAAESAEASQFSRTFSGGHEKEDENSTYDEDVAQYVR